jgi:hypothetical protein
MSEFRGETRSEFASVKGDIKLLKWMVGLNLAFTVAILWKVFSTGIGQ